MDAAGKSEAGSRQKAEAEEQPLKDKTASTNPSSTGGLDDDTGSLPRGFSAAQKAPPLRTPPNSPQHVLFPTVPISIAAAPRKQSPLFSEESASSSHPPHIPTGRTPPQEGILSAAAGLVSEGGRLSKQDPLSHSPSPSRRRPPLSPSSSSGGMTPPKMYGAPSPKPTQKGFYNPYGKNPYRVTGFVPGSPKGSKAPVPVATLSAETENDLLEATERGLFSEGVEGASQTVAESERILSAGETVSGPESYKGVIGISGEVAGETSQGMGELGVTETEQERKRRKSEEGSEGAIDAQGAASSMELPSSTAEPRLTPVSPLPSSDGSGVNRPSLDLGVNRPSFVGSGVSQPSFDLGVNRPISDGCGVNRPTFDSGANRPNSDGGDVNRPTFDIGRNRPSSEGSGVNRPSSEAGVNRNSARDRWRRARLHVTAARAFSYGGLGGFSEVANDGSSAGKKQTAPTKTAASIDAPSADSITRTASIAPPTPGTAAGDTSRDRGRRRFEGIEVREERHWTVVLSDLYIHILKAPLLEFLLVVFLFPALLCLVFAPLYLLDIQGLQCDDCKPPLPSPAQNTPLEALEAHSLCHVLLYSLSLSMLFGGSPVEAHSRYTLLVANLQTLAAQFTFVFLSGAVFSRMSQRSQPVRCARKAVIRQDDVTAEEGDVSERHRIFTTRLVLKGPEPAVLVDVRIQLTFRVFLQQRNGSVFCSTSALDLVRPEVAYLQYGIAVKHVIDRDSPLYGHTQGSLLAGDSSFSLTILGTERSSLQSIFHMQEYFLSDGDVIWDGDFVGFVSIDAKGGRVIDHSQLDKVKRFRTSANVPRAIMRMQNLVRTMKRGAKSRDNSKEEARRKERVQSSRALEPVQEGGDDSLGGSKEAEKTGLSACETRDIDGEGESGVTVNDPMGSKGGEDEAGVSPAAEGLEGLDIDAEVEESEEPVGDVVREMMGPAYALGKGLPQDVLQTLRRRKLDKDGDGSSAQNASSSGSPPQRYNAGF